MDRLINRVWRGLIDKIYLISSTANYDKTYDRILGNVTRITNYFPGVLAAIMKREAKKHGNKRRVLLYFDDMGGQGIDITLRPSDPFAKLTTISRHIGTEIDPALGWLVVVAAQCLSLVPTVYRKNCDKVAMFLEDNPEERRHLQRTYGFCKDKNFASFMEDNLTKPHDFLFLSKDQGFSTWWKNMTVPLSKQVEAIKESERLGNKRTYSQRQSTTYVPQNQYNTNYSSNLKQLHNSRSEVQLSTSKRDLKRNSYQSY